jgi:hypothetical protein
MTDVARHIGAHLSVVICYAIFYSLVASLDAWVLLIANYGMTRKRRAKLNAWADEKLRAYEQDW